MTKNNNCYEYTGNLLYFVFNFNNFHLYPKIQAAKAENLTEDHSCCNPDIHFDLLIHKYKHSFSNLEKSKVGGTVLKTIGFLVGSWWGIMVAWTSTCETLNWQVKKKQLATPWERNLSTPSRASHNRGHCRALNHLTHIKFETDRCFHLFWPVSPLLRWAELSCAMWGHCTPPINTNDKWVIYPTWGVATKLRRKLGK